jgi:hypothetical protein
LRKAKRSGVRRGTPRRRRPKAGWPPRRLLDQAAREDDVVFRGGRPEIGEDEVRPARHGHLKPIARSTSTRKSRRRLVLRAQRPEERVVRAARRRGHRRVQRHGDARSTVFARRHPRPLRDVISRTCEDVSDLAKVVRRATRYLRRQLDHRDVDPSDALEALATKSVGAPIKDDSPRRCGLGRTFLGRCGC